jgi:hypothetical protein
VGAEKHAVGQSANGRSEPVTDKAHPGRKNHRGIAHAARPIGVALLAVAALMLPTGNMAVPQSPGQPTISIAAVLAEPAAQVPLRIQVAEGSVPRSSFIRLKGLPSMAALSEGHSTAPGSWAIPLSALNGLKVTLPKQATGEFEVIVTLVNTDGSVLGEARTKLVIQGETSTSAPAPQPGTKATVAVKTAPSTAAEGGGSPPPVVAPGMSAKARERALKLFREGNGHMAQGNVSAARLVYELAAEAGLASAAMALAGTYDAGELAKLNVLGVQPDDKAAKRWYELARQLGEAEAEQRLQRLGAK